MIDHTNCDHERTSSARARCRRQIKSGDKARPKASTKDVDFSGSGGAKSQTPGFKSDECHVCHVERIEFLGTDAWTGMTVMVGERCAWRVKRSDDFRALP